MCGNKMYCQMYYMGEKEQNNNVHKCKVSCFSHKKLLHSIVCRQSYDRKNRVIAHCRHPQLRDKKSEREGERTLLV